MITKGDKILICVVLLLSFLLLAAFQIFGFAAEKTYAVIEVNGKLFQKILLGENGSNFKLTVPAGNHKSIVEVDKDKVRIIYSDCPDQDCVRQGWISRPGQIIVCLPNKIVIKIVNGNTGHDNDIDGVSF
ncbi:lipoprotein [Tepidanaerobacter syntrophicus]|uniref:Uncharacterized protein n=1 Tax=Tepidanaerobacter syntrophicus TaxID=224999 RepID=A0A0U9HIK7_9FIRM|nr:NusG domain II-containing protein [Tepidanaerobacter syntrophicus]GAQ25979.1 hypothetical protein TSYNT_9232 [Tepidanaerobacter syntrophicus]GLI19699.1 lipoprotein [Tepidanaerobacter syntrophicus]GLI50404.1 lipoprotein [Tepidanaerobacter syntrophicus]HHV83327.1 NusG domain II-containing protein [Tepidanaerobacter syntrophicus]